MKNQDRPLIEQTKHAAGEYGGFSFGGSQPDGVVVHKPLPRGTEFPNGARAALLLTFDVEGNYGNGTGNEELEIMNYDRICSRLEDNGIPATFNIVGKMVEDRDSSFVQRMLASGSEIAAHGYVHDLNKKYGGDKVYAGHYGPDENRVQVRDGIRALEEKVSEKVNGYRLPYGHFNEYSYDAIEKAGLQWTSHVGIEYGSQPFQMRLGDRIYDLVEIPLDNQTFDWPIWIADEKTNQSFVEITRAFCRSRDIPFIRTPKGGVAIWQQRMSEAIKDQAVFTLLCHPINLTLDPAPGEDPLEQFLLQVIDLLGELNKTKKAWVCTCAEMSAFYRRVSL